VTFNQPGQFPGLPFGANQPEPDARAVEKFHRRSDVDSRREAQHHTLGTDPTQSSPGNHTHDGSDSPSILTGTSLTGSRSDGTAVASIIDALVALGATDSTSP
jgi:hypothetical protein